MDDITIRASRAPILDQCCGMLNGDLHVDSSSDVATLGTAVHEVCQRIVQTGDRPSDLTPWIERDGLDADEFGRLTWYAVQAWSELSDRLTNETDTEVDMRRTLPSLSASGTLTPVSITGHADVLASSTDGGVVVLDWKTGRKTDANVYPQLMVYAWLALYESPLSPHALAGSVWLRDQTVQLWKVSKDSVNRWMDRFCQRLVDWDGQTFRAGDHCTFCPRRYDCPARTAMIRSVARDLTDDSTLARMAEHTDLATPEAVVSLYQRAQQLDTVLGEFRKLVRARLEQTGPLDTAHHTLQLADRTVTKIDPQKAWPVLSKYLDEDSLAQVVRIRKGEMEKQLAAHAPRGSKAAIKAQVLDELDAVEALEQHTTHTLQLKQKERTNDE